MPAVNFERMTALAVGRVINYVSGYTQGTGNTTGVPIVTPFNSGISLTLEAVKDVYVFTVRSCISCGLVAGAVGVNWTPPIHSVN